jgi:hypothetical protein
VRTSAVNPSTLSQAIKRIDAGDVAATGYTAAGVRQTVAATPGKVYLFAGYQDTYTADFGSDGDRYVHDFGINVTGGTAPGTPAL